MSVCIDCDNMEPAIACPEEEQVCRTTIRDNVWVQGTVTITPRVVSGPSTSFCVGRPIIGNCPGELRECCEFTVSQNICVQIPLTFSATARAMQDGIVCGRPNLGRCEEICDCTQMIDLLRNGPDHMMEV